MATQILATGSTPADSADVTVAAGSTLGVSLKDPGFGCEVRVYLKDDAGAYQHISNLLNKPNENSATISTPGVYRFSRVAGTCGVFSA